MRTVRKLDTNQRIYIKRNYQRMSKQEMARNLDIPYERVNGFMAEKKLVRTTHIKARIKQPPVVIPEGCFDYNNHENYGI